MKTLIKIMVVAIIVAAIGAIVPGPADAQNFSTSRPGGRGGSWELLLSPLYVESATINGKGGSSVDLNDDWGFGFGAAYNFNDHFQLNGLTTYSSRSYEATVVLDNGTTRRYNNTMESHTLSLNGVYYFLSGNITPFVSGGVGYTWMDTNIQDGPASGTCWYDPWYGQVCNTYVHTKTETEFSYNAGLGLRFDVNRKFGLQAGYYKTWIDIDNASDTPDFDIWRFDFIIRFGN
jgi:opacity protein-like surface antigen